MKILFIRIWVLGIVLVISPTVLAQDEGPDVNELLRWVRLSAVQQDGELVGELKKGRNSHRLVMFLKGDRIQYQIDVPKAGNRSKAERLILELQLSEEAKPLRYYKDNSWSQFPKSRYAENIGATDITFEDLSLRFLYWPNGKIVGEDNIQSVACYRILLRNPDGYGTYSSVLLWVGKDNGALMRIEGFDQDNNPLKRFAVAQVMKIEQGYFIESMRVAPFIPGSGRLDQPTYLKFQRPTKPAPRRPD
jgi:hypothetical protein